MDATSPETPYRNADLRPFDLLKRSRQLIGEDYLLFLGMTTTGFLLAYFVPFCVLSGPMVCGVFYALRAKQRGEKVEFGMLFKGFDVFLESFLATLIIVAAVMLLMLPFIALFVLVVLGLSMGDLEEAVRVPSLIVAVLGYISTMSFLSFVVGALFMFTFPLVLDKELGPLDAVRVSLGGVFANGGGIIKLVFVYAVLVLLGTACCYVGAFFLYPWIAGATWLAYQDVFGSPASSSDPSAA